MTNSVAQAPYCYESVFLTLRSKTNHLGAFRAFFSLEECTRSFRLAWEGSVLCLTCVLMIDNEPSSELCACVDIDVRGRSGGRMAL